MASSLSLYNTKRDFRKTPEPSGRKASSPGKNRYLIQKHAATRLHYDFRLELDGVLKSWAVTRGPSLDPQDRRLAVEVEDHPLDYGDFEGVIPKGQYGGGTVMLWDTGSWEPIGDARQGLASGKLSFRLHGKRLKGEWALLRMKDRERGRHHWLLIKKDDEEARPGKGDALVNAALTSIVSKRSMERIARDREQVWQSKPKGNAAPEPATPKRQAAVGKALSFIPPQLATLSARMPSGKSWVHEVKFDGYRVQTLLENGEARLLTRTGKDWTPKFRALAQELEALKAKTAVMDGEVVAVNENGIASFKNLQETLSRDRNAPLQYYVFDLLHLNGEDLTGLPLLERKRRLKALLATAATPHVFYSEHFTGGGDVLKETCRLGLEGVISKQAGGAYLSGRGRDWLKSKCQKRQEFVIGGYTLPSHGGKGVGALLIGTYEGGMLRYAGKVGTGFTAALSQDVRRKLEQRRRKASPFAEVPSLVRRAAHWVRPELVCEIEFTEWTPEGRLRHPSFQGLREDKPARSVSRDVPVSPPSGSGGKAAKLQIEGIAITHPGRVVYPGQGFTKGMAAEYYAHMAEHILPHILGRPLSIMRCPEGTGSACFFQRHPGGGIPHVREVKVQGKKEVERYLTVENVKGLISLIQWGALELHPWGSRADRPDLPDRLIFDLDPDPGVAWADIVSAAREVRDRLRKWKLRSFLKTTGGKGLHVTVPIMRRHGWEEVKAFCKALALSMAEDSPERYTVNMRKAERKGRIFVDYLRNETGATAVAAYSLRARDDATVATPLAWEELKASLDPKQFTLETVPRRLERRQEPWEEMFALKQPLFLK